MGNSSIRNDEVVEFVPVTVPHHKAIELIVIVLDPLLELSNDRRWSIVTGSSSLCRCEHTHDQFISINAIKVGDGSGPLSKPLQVNPVQIDLLKVVQTTSCVSAVPVVVGLRLIVVNVGISHSDNGYKVVKGLSTKSRVRY